MFRTLILLIALSISIASSAQINKGAILLDGAGSFRYDDSSSKQSAFNIKSENTSLNLNLSPSIGFFTSNTALIGFGISYQFTRGTAEGNNLIAPTKQTAKQHVFMISTYVRKYVPIADKLYFTGTLRISAGPGISRLRFKEEGEEEQKRDADIFQANISLTPGLSYFVSERWAITASIGQLYFSYYSTNPDQDEIASQESISTGLNFSLNSFSVGVHYLLRNGSSAE